MSISLTAWLARAFLITLLLAASAIYGRGLVLLHEENRPARWQSVLFFAGLILLAVTLVSPLDSLVATWFTARALQQLLLTELIPFLLLIANPFRTLRAGTPDTLRSLLRPIWQHELRGNILTFATTPALVWLFFVTTFWFWHDTAMIALVSRNGWAHGVEVVSLLGISALYWWHITGSEPNIHRPMSLLVRLMYTFIGILPIKLTGIIMLFNNETMVGGRRVVADDALRITLGNVSLTDNTVGSIIIWVIGGIMYACAALLLASRFIGREEDKPPLPVNPLEDDELWVAPGLGLGSGVHPYQKKGPWRKS